MRDDDKVSLKKKKKKNNKETETIQMNETEILELKIQ